MFYITGGSNEEVLQLNFGEAAIAAVVRNPHDPDAQWSANGKGKEKKTWVGYKAQIAESLPEKDALSQNRFITSIRFMVPIRGESVLCDF